MVCSYAIWTTNPGGIFSWQDSGGNLIQITSSLPGGLRQVSDCLAVNRAADKGPSSGTDGEEQGVLMLDIPLKSERNPVDPSKNEDVWFLGCCVQNGPQFPEELGIVHLTKQIQGWPLNLKEPFFSSSGGFIQ